VSNLCVLITCVIFIIYVHVQATSLVRELPLGNITSMQKDKGKAKDKKEIGIVANIVTGDSKISIGFTDETQSSQWLLAIDGQRARVYGSCMEAIERVRTRQLTSTR